MHAMAPNRFKRTFRPATAVIVMLALMVAVWLLLRQEHVYPVRVKRGSQTTVTVETRMQRTFEHKSFAKERGLPVVCRLIGMGTQNDDVRLRVVDTGHRLHFMWAMVQIEVAPEAEPGRRKWVGDFSIDGNAGWPKITLVVVVRR